MPDYVRETEEKSLQWFLDTVIVSDIRAVIDSGAGYLAFSLIAQSIELLGALLDENDFEFYEKGLPEARFSKGITQLFRPINAKYAQYNKADSEYYLWENLRCGMAHIVRPKSRILFTGRSEASRSVWKHLEEVNVDGTTCLLMVIEDFHDDLREACRRAINKIPKKTHAKLKQGYITVRQFVDPSGLGMSGTSGYGGTTDVGTITGSLPDFPKNG